MRPVYALLAFLGTSAHAAPVVERTSVWNGNNGIPDGSKNLLDYLGGIGDIVQRINKALPISVDVDLPILPSKREDSDDSKHSKDAVTDYINRLEDYIRKILGSLPEGGLDLHDDLGLTKRTWGKGNHDGWGKSGGWGHSDHSDNNNGGGDHGDDNHGGNGQGDNNQGNNGQGNNNQTGNGQGQNNQGGNGQNSNPWDNFNWSDFDLNGLLANLRNLFLKIGITGPVQPGNGGVSIDLGGLSIE